MQHVRLRYQPHMMNNELKPLTPMQELPMPTTSILSSESDPKALLVPPPPYLISPHMISKGYILAIKVSWECNESALRGGTGKIESRKLGMLGVESVGP